MVAYRRKYTGWTQHLQNHPPSDPTAAAQERKHSEPVCFSPLLTPGLGIHLGSCVPEWGPTDFFSFNTPIHSASILIRLIRAQSYALESTENNRSGDEKAFVKYIWGLRVLAASQFQSLHVGLLLSVFVAFIELLALDLLPQACSTYSSHQLTFIYIKTSVAIKFVFRCSKPSSASAYLWGKGRVTGRTARPLWTHWCWLS